MTIAVVGAGIVGCAVAFELAHRGLRVEVFDSRHVGGGATQATAGVLAPFIEAPSSGLLHEMTVESFKLYDQFVARAHEASGVQVEYRRCGTIELMETSDDERRLEGAAALARAAGVDVDWMQLSPEDDAGATGRGLLIPSHGYVRVEQLMTALRAGAEARGARFNEEEGIQRIETLGTGIVLHTAKRRLGCDAVVVAAGSWSDAIGGEAVGIRPVRGQIVRVGLRGPLPRHILWTHGCYVVPWADGTLLVGATVEEAGFDERVTVQGVGGLLRAVARLLPGAADATFLDARAGLRPASADGVPVIRPSRRSSRIIYATGHYRNGVLLAPLTSHRVADLVGAIR